MRKMINRLEEAVRSGNVAAVRVALVEAVQNRADKPATLHSMRYAISATPGLFEPDNGRIEILDRESWTNGYVRRMIKAINENFSSEKLSRLLEVCSIMKRRPQEFRRANRAEKKMEQAMAAAEPVEVVEEVASVVDDNGAVVLEIEELDTEFAGKMPGAAASHSARVSKAGRITGYVLIALGLVCLIVGLCIPMRLLLGIGIGAVLVGSAVAYNYLQRDFEAA